MRRGISLAGKCLLLFGSAIALIIVAALWAPWMRMTALIDAGQLELSRQLVDTWQRLAPLVDAPPAQPTLTPLVRRDLSGKEERAGIIAREFTFEQAEAAARNDPFIRSALDAFLNDVAIADFQQARWSGTLREYRYAKAHRVRLQGRSQITSVVVLDRRSIEATRLLVLNTSFLLAAGGVVGLLAMTVFYFITRTLILRPVRALKSTAERVREGNLAIRADIRTRDEFEQLAETFNSMLNDMQTSQDRLRSINAALDLKLHELAESNQALYQAAKVKGEFLANVSHELRTPLNSINGFAELLMEQAKADGERPDPPPSVPKRIRYLDNILTAGKGLLNLINSLLEMARIEAGKVEIRVERMNLRDACEGLLGLIAPLADKKGIQLRLDVAEDVPVISTDVKKFQQIVFNFLSNAVKFTETAERTGRTPQIVLRAERLVSTGDSAVDRVRVSVIDNGPGIPKEDLTRVFEKFYQRDATHTREHTGTGLGLAISKELAGVLDAEIQVDSEIGRGSMFSLILPPELQPRPREEVALEARFKAVLSGSREWS